MNKYFNIFSNHNYQEFYSYNILHRESLPLNYNRNFKRCLSSGGNSNFDNNINFKYLPNDDILLNRELRGGYKSYYANVFSLGNLQVCDNEEMLIKKLFVLINNLDESKIYRFLFIIRYYDNDIEEYKGITLSKAIIINKGIDIELLKDRILIDISANKLKYDLSSNDSELLITAREWLSESDFKGKMDVISKTLNDVIKDSVNVNENMVEDIIKNRINEGKFAKYSTLNSVNYLDNLEKIYDNDWPSKELYKFNDKECLDIKRIINSEQLEIYVYVRSIINGKVIFTDNPILSWVDYVINDNIFERKVGLLSYVYENGNVIKKEASYNYPNFRVAEIDLKFNDKIGAIDFETFGSRTDGLGLHNVYAAGWATNNMSNFYYLNLNESSDNLVYRLFEDIFSKGNNVDDYTFYIHNLGRFDSVFLIKSLYNKKGYKLDITWKDNSILSIIIRKDKYKITLLDSMKLVQVNLYKLLKDFKCEIQKSTFPHKFVNKNTLYYSGELPEYKYYDKIDIKVYNYLRDKAGVNWNLQEECLKYLVSDVKGLLEAMVKLNDSIFHNYNLNITRFKTLPSLSMAVFTSGYFDEDFNIKVIKGFVEKDIRKGYFGGNVNVYENEIGNAYLYDMNSQYPFAMLNDMPIGNPIFSTDTNLDNYFGFVYGEVIPPSEKELKNLYIQYRDSKNRVSLPRTNFSRMIFSEEIKSAIKDGYKFKVIYGYKFERGIDVFTNFVKEFYDSKKNASNDVDRLLAKLFLNSLYGKFGMKDIYSKIKIVSNKNGEFLKKHYNYSFFGKLDEDHSIIKYSSRVNEKIRKLYKNDETNLNKAYQNIGLSRNIGVVSSVQIAAAISAYARMSINKFKNLPNNPCIYSDTDSVILKYKLDEKYVGNELGQFKLEHEIKKGIFIRNKLYIIQNSEGNYIVKASGVDGNKLNWNSFVDLLNGKDILTDKTSFNIKWSQLNLDVVRQKIKLRGVGKEEEIGGG